jgi:plastocyanin
MKPALGRACGLAALIGLVPAAGWAQASQAAASAPAAAEVATVHIRDNRFDPPTLRVRVGTTVRWVNAERRTTHSVLFTGPGGRTQAPGSEHSLGSPPKGGDDLGSGPSVIESDRLFPGEHFERRFDQPGRYPYTCGPHPEMHGVVEVEP